MKLSYLGFPAFFAIAALAISGCATPGKAPISADADPQVEIQRVSASIEDARSKQYEQLAPTKFKRAVEYRNLAQEKLRKGDEHARILSDIAVSLQAVSEVQSVGDASSSTMRSVLAARQNAIHAQAPQFQEKLFRAADGDLRDIGVQLEAGKYQLEAKELMSIEKKFSLAEIAARKQVELGATRTQINLATNQGAKGKVPSTLEKALAKTAAAEQAIEMSPHNPAGYAASIVEAKLASQKLGEVMGIALSSGAKEEVALTIWNQNRALESSRAELSKANTDFERRRQATKGRTDAELANTQAIASVEQAQMENAIAAKNARLDKQHESIAALKSENREFADSEEQKQRLAEIMKTFSSDEAEVMKDGKNIVVRLKKMQFSAGRSELNPDSFATLKKVDSLISAVSVTQVTVEGHTDSIGTDKLNQSLSEERAEAVKMYLLSQGLPDSLKVATAGFGSGRPLSTNKTKDGRAINRRVDIVIETPSVL